MNVCWQLPRFPHGIADSSITIPSDYFRDELTSMPWVSWHTTGEKARRDFRLSPSKGTNPTPFPKRVACRSNDSRLHGILGEKPVRMINRSTKNRLGHVAPFGSLETLSRRVTRASLLRLCSSPDRLESLDTVFSRPKNQQRAKADHRITVLTRELDLIKRL